MELRTIAPTSLEAIKKKRVVVYARVSSDKDAAENSLGAQLAYFRQKILATPNWQFVQCYADEGISGTKEERPGFLKMMEAARKGEIDIIITKSITRLARNTVILLSTIRELKSLGIDIIFDNDHVSLNTVQGELLISLLAAHAEEQSRSASENKRWQIKRDFENGRPTFFRMYGYKWDDGYPKIVPEEAKIVRRIFSMYLDGMGYKSIAHELNREGITIWGNAWCEHSVSNILKNEKHVGDLLLQKWHVPDFRTKKQYFNHGEWKQYLIPNNHKPIIDRETFDAVQKEMARRREAQKSIGENCQAAPIASDNRELFKKIIHCGKCGRPYYFKKLKVKYGNKFIPIWTCSTYIGFGKEYCNAKQIREPILIDKTREALGLKQDQELTRELIDKHLFSIESAADNRLRFFFRDGSVKEIPWENPSRSQSWTPEMKEKARQDALKRDREKKQTLEPTSKKEAK